MEPRHYRLFHQQADWEHFRVVVEETDLDIALSGGQSSIPWPALVKDLVLQTRRLLKAYIRRDPPFLTTLLPHEPQEDAPEEVLKMCEAAQAAGVGPMAAVAGLLAEKVGVFLGEYAPDVIVENGGDIWLKTAQDRIVAVFAGPSPFSMRIGVKIKGGKSPLGICTSSGTVGHSLSFGKADAVVILSPSAVLADGVATAAANLVQKEEDLAKAVNFALGIPGVTGALAIKGDKLSAGGGVELCPL